jgi:hypothetical protein
MAVTHCGIHPMATTMTKITANPNASFLTICEPSA